MDEDTWVQQTERLVQCGPARQCQMAIPLPPRHEPEVPAGEPLCHMGCPQPHGVTGMFPKSSVWLWMCNQNMLESGRHRGHRETASKPRRAGIKSLCTGLGKSNTERAPDPAIPLLSINPKELKAGTHTRTPTFTAAMLTIARRWKPPRCPRMGEWITSKTSSQTEKTT